MTEKGISPGFRLGSIFLDHFNMCVIIVPPLIIVRIILKFESFENKPIEAFAFYLMMLVYLNKDFVKGKSIAKRGLGLVVVDHRAGSPASDFKCFLRNMTIPLWPLEVVISIFSPTRRLGDLIANTRVELTEKETLTSIVHDLKRKRFTRNTLWTFLVGVIYMGVFWYLINSLMWM